MRKFTLLFTLVAFTSFLFAQTVSTDECNLTKQDLVQMPVTKSAVATKAPGDIYWEEDFDSVRWHGVTATTMPAGWSVYDAVGEDFYWIWSMEGPKGRYTSPNGAPGVLKANQTPNQGLVDAIDNLGGTGYNGFVMLNGDWYNTGEDGQLAANTIAMDSYIQVTEIDLTDAIGATLKFNQIYRWCCSGANQLSVFVASDYDASLPEDEQTPHWIELDARGLLGTVNNYTSLIDRSIQFDISAVAAGMDNVTLRFHKIGASHYVWIVDDIKIVEPNANDIVATRAWWYYAEAPYTGEGADPDLDWTGGYTKIPVAQKQDFVGFKMAVNNFGLSDLSSVKLNVVVAKDGAEVYNETGLGKAIDSGVKDTVALNTPFTPSGIGEYQVSSTVIMEVADQDPSNNSFSYDFAITQDVYSRVYEAPYPLRTYTGAWVSGGTPGDALMSKFEIYEDAKILSVTTYVWRNNRYDYQVADMDNGDYAMIGRLYKVDEETGEPSNTPIISTDLRQITWADTMSMVTMDYILDGEAEFLTPGEYYAAIETYSSSADVMFEIGEDDRVQQPVDNAYAWFSGELGGIDANPVIVINIAGSDGKYNVTFNADMSKYDAFDPANDVVYVAGSFAGWAEPGSDASLELTDEDEDMIYTLTMRLEPGEYAYKYFLNAGWDGGEWTGDPNREFEVVNNDVVLNDVFGPVSVGTLDLTDVSIYPNPVSEELNITNMNGVDRIVISNIIGQEVMTVKGFDRSVNINTSNLDNGVYVVTFIDARNNAQSTRIIKR